MNADRPPFSFAQWLTHAWLARGPLALLLWPVSRLFAALGALRRHLYQTGFFEVRRAPALVVVVGNVVAGGAGKTPVVLALVRHLEARGIQVGVISRGYGRSASGCMEVLPDSPVCDVGDEPALIKRLTCAPVFVASSRFEAAQALLAGYPETPLILCDDGLQHLGLHRDIEICVFDDRGVGNGFLLPAGPLREPWPKPVDLVLHTGAHPAFAGFAAERALAALAMRADGTQIALADLARQSTKPLLALAGIAKPEAFFAMLRAQGLPLAQTIAFPDHHDFKRFSYPDYAAFTVICTEKDAIKLWPQNADAWAVPLVFTLHADFLAAFDGLIDQGLAKSPHPRLSSPHGHTTT